MTDAHKPLPEIKYEPTLNNPREEMATYSSIKLRERAIAQRLKDIVSKRMLIEKELCLEIQQLIEELEKVN